MGAYMPVRPFNSGEFPVSRYSPISRCIPLFLLFLFLSLSYYYYSHYLCNFEIIAYVPTPFSHFSSPHKLRNLNEAKYQLLKDFFKS